MRKRLTTSPRGGRAFDRVAFLVRLVQLRPDRLTPRQRAQLLRDLERFMLPWAGRDVMLIMAPRLRPAPTVKDLRMIQADLAVLLEGVVGTLDRQSPSRDRGIPGQAGVSITASVAFSTFPGQSLQDDR